jgi:hypothetical protein
VNWSAYKKNTLVGASQKGAQTCSLNSQIGCTSATWTHTAGRTSNHLTYSLRSRMEGSTGRRWMQGQAQMGHSRDNSLLKREPEGTCGACRVCVCVCVLSPDWAAAPTEPCMQPCNHNTCTMRLGTSHTTLTTPPYRYFPRTVPA